MTKLSVRLGLREKTSKTYGNMILDMMKKFKNHQGLFIGHKNTYDPIGEYADDESKRSFVNVESTVDDQLEWFVKYSKDYMSIALSIEATNASGKARAELIVDGTSWGDYSTLELLGLKNILSRIKMMVQDLPIRSEKEIWNVSIQPEFKGRKVWETPIDEGFATTTLKRKIVVDDPMIGVAPLRAPVTQDIDTKVNIGKYKRQRFSGAITNLERAAFEVKIDLLDNAIIMALETANNIDAIDSNLGDKMLEYLF